MTVGAIFERWKRQRAAAPPEPLPPLRLNVEAELVYAPAPAGEEGGPGWWHSPYGRWRFTAEAEAMRRFPEFRATVDDAGLLGWAGWLHSALPGRNPYLVRVTYPECFPDEAPSVAIVRPQLPHEVPHLLSGQHPCLYSPHRDGYDPARTTAATLVAWTALWIHAFETWRSTGDWPGEAA